MAALLLLRNALPTQKCDTYKSAVTPSMRPYDITSLLSFHRLRHHASQPDSLCSTIPRFVRSAYTTQLPLQRAYMTVAESRICPSPCVSRCTLSLEPITSLFTPLHSFGDLTHSYIRQKLWCRIRRALCPFFARCPPSLPALLPHSDLSGHPLGHISHFCTQITFQPPFLVFIKSACCVSL